MTKEQLELELQLLKARMKELETVVQARTTLAADITYSRRDVSWAIMVGRYGSRDYVQTFELPNTDFQSMVRRLNELERYAEVRRLDSPFQVRAVFDRGRRDY